VNAGNIGEGEVRFPSRAAHQLTMWLPPPRATRAPEYTAPKPCGRVNDLVKVWRCMVVEHSCWRRVGNL
jgi:hypothetical protein